MAGQALQLHTAVGVNTRTLLLAATLLLAISATVRAADVPVPATGTSSRIDTIRRRGTLRVAVLGEYPWLKQSSSGDKPFEGPAWRLAEEYASRLGVKLEIVPVRFDDKVFILKGGQVDITVAPLLVTADRGKLVDFIPYSVSAQCLFGLADNPKVARAESIDDLNRPDVTITYITGTMQDAWLTKRLPEAIQHGVSGKPTDVSLYEILSRRADVTSIDKFFFAGFAKEHPGLVTVPKGDACLASQELSIPVGMAIDKDQPVFLAWLRAVAEAIMPQTHAEELRVEKAGS